MRRRSTRAFTIIEVIVIVVILGVIAAVIAPRLINRIGQSKQSVARNNAASLASQVRLFEADHRRVQAGDTISILWTRPGDVAEEGWEPYVDSPDALVDPWGNMFMLVIPGEKNYDFDVVSYGKDGQPGGETEDEDIRAP